MLSLSNGLHMPKKIFTPISLLLCALFSSTAQADVTIGATRVIYPGDAKDASITIENTGDEPFLVQSWVQSIADDGRTSDAPFMVTPPLFRLNGKQKNVLRIIRTGGNLAEDRESLFWLDIKSIPSSTPGPTQNKLVLAVKSEFKLIYRPTSLTQIPEKVTDQLIWQRLGNQLSVKNPTPYYMNFATVNAGAAKIKSLRYLAPYSTQSVALPAGASGPVTWALINDFGGTGPMHKQL